MPLQHLYLLVTRQDLMSRNIICQSRAYQCHFQHQRLQKLGGPTYGYQQQGNSLSSNEWALTHSPSEYRSSPQHHHLELPRRPLKTDPMAVLQGHPGVGFSKDPINVLVTFALYFNPQGSTYRTREMYAYLMYFDPYIAVMRYQERL